MVLGGRLFALPGSTTAGGVRWNVFYVTTDCQVALGKKDWLKALE